MMLFPSRDLITKTVLTLLKPEHDDNDLHRASVTWWQNLRSSGGYGLTMVGAKAFDTAELQFVEFDNGASSIMTDLALRVHLDKKMTVPYYFFIEKKRQKIRVYDERISLLIILYDGVTSYLKSIE